MKNLIFILLLFVSIFSFGQARNNNPNVFNVKLFGATGNGTTNDTRAIQAAITACSAAGGGYVFFPNGTYVLSDTLVTASNSQLYIPAIINSSALRNRVVLRGESKPSLIPIGGGLSGASNTTPPPTSGVILKTSGTTYAAGAAVIGINSTGISGTEFTVENIAIQIKNNPSGTGPVIGGINGKFAGSIEVRDVSVYIDTSGFRSTLPVNDVAGIETPNQGCDNGNIIENVVVIGMKSGIKAGEHLTMNQVSTFCCYYGFFIKTTQSASVGIRLESQWNAYDIYGGGGSATLGDWNLITEWQQIGKWYDYVAMIKDSANNLTGLVKYKYIFANGIALTIVLKSGGANISVTEYGAIAKAVLPVITASALDSTIILGGQGSTSSLILKATNITSTTAPIIFKSDNTTERMRLLGTGFLGIGTTTPATDLDVGTASPSIRLNRSSATGTPGYFFASQGTNKWVMGMDNLANGLPTWYVYDYTKAKTRLWADTSGNLNLGGTASAAGTAAIAIDNSNNIGFNNNGFTYTASTNTISSAIATHSTSITSPIIIGGTGAGSSLSLRSTSGTGTSDAIIFQTGTNGATEAMRILTGGQIAYGQTTLLRANNIATWVKNANTEASFSISNNNGGTGAYSALFLGNSTGAANGVLYLFGGGYTTSNQYAQGTMLTEAGSTLGLSALSGTINFFTNSSEKMRITNAGLVGIGLTPTTDKLEVSGNIALTTAGNKLKILTGTNASIGVSGAMTAGTITISTTAVTASSKIFLVHATLGGVQGILSVGTITGGTSFVINSSSAADTGTVNWWIVN